MSNQEKYVEVGAGWKRQSKSKGAPYVSISLNGDHGLDLALCWVSLMRNNRKGSNPDAPDYIVTAKPKESRRPSSRRDRSSHDDRDDDDIFP